MCPNADRVAYDRVVDQIVYIAHEEMDPNIDNLDPNNCVVHLPANFDQFWETAANRADFPSDAYDAEQLFGRTGR